MLVIAVVVEPVELISSELSANDVLSAAEKLTELDEPSSSLMPENSVERPIRLGSFVGDVDIAPFPIAREREAQTPCVLEVRKAEQQQIPTILRKWPKGQRRLCRKVHGKVIKDLR